MPLFSGPGVNPSLRGLSTNVISLSAGETWLVQPAGWYYIRPGKYSCLQEYDPITTTWRTIGAMNSEAGVYHMFSDGTNYRLANQTGCVVGALITTAGTGVTAVPTVAASAGGSKWQAIVGGAISTTVTVSTGGSNYTYPPQVLFSAPPTPGIQATGYCTLSTGAVSTVTVVDQGAGYTAPPTISFINDPREGFNGIAVGSGASAIASLTGAQTVTGLLCIDHGNPVTGNSVPTLAFTPTTGSPAATAIMCWTVLYMNVSYGASGSFTGSPPILTAWGGFPSTAPAYTNVSTQSQLVKGRPAYILGSLSGVYLLATFSTSQVVYDGGIFAGVPTGFVAFTNGAGVASTTMVPQMGSVSGDVSIVLTQ